MRHEFSRLKVCSKIMYTSNKTSKILKMVNGYCKKF